MARYLEGKMQIKLLIAGTRTFNDYHLLQNILSKVKSEIIEIVSGTARGADTLGERYAMEHNIPIKRFYPDWDSFGKRAVMLRNREMAKYTDKAIVFWDGESRGTKNMIDEMKKLNKEVIIVYYKNEVKICY